MRKLMKKARRALAAASAVAGFVAIQAYAAIPTEVGTELAAIETDAAALRDAVWPYVIAIAGMVIVIKLTKRFMAKV